MKWAGERGWRRKVRYLPHIFSAGSFRGQRREEAAWDGRSRTSGGRLLRRGLGRNYVKDAVKKAGR
jgi:hypothetical protein